MFWTRLWLLFLLLVSLVGAEDFGLRLRQGKVPILIVAGHGGQRELPNAEVRSPDRVEDRHFVIFGDARTNELAEALANAIAVEFGDSPSLIQNDVHRRYCDVNRTLALSTHDPVGRAHHAAYHALVAAELERMLQSHSRVLLLDIHGQIRYETTLLLGTAENAVVGPWSLQALWGGSGLVKRLEKAGLSAEPTTPEGKQRYGGGYTVRHHGVSKRVEAWQMEHARKVRDNDEDRAAYVQVVARALHFHLQEPGLLPKDPTSR